MNETKGEHVSKCLKIVAILLVIVFVITDYIENKKQTSDDDFGTGEAIGMTIWSLIGGFIALACGSKCSKWAREINKSMNWAYAIGFLFSLLGLLVYFIYYKSKEIKRKKKQLTKGEQIKQARKLKLIE